MLQWLLAAHHVPERSEFELFIGGLYRGFFAFALGWLFYIVLEPYARRLWPRTMISWVRLLDGRRARPPAGTGRAGRVPRGGRLQSPAAGDRSRARLAGRRSFPPRPPASSRDAARPERDPGVARRARRGARQHHDAHPLPLRRAPFPAVPPAPDLARDRRALGGIRSRLLLRLRVPADRRVDHPLAPSLLPVRLGRDPGRHLHRRPALRLSPDERSLARGTPTRPSSPPARAWRWPATASRCRSAGDPPSRTCSRRGEGTADRASYRAARRAVAFGRSGARKRGTDWSAGSEGRGRGDSHVMPPRHGPAAARGTPRARRRSSSCARTGPRAARTRRLRSAPARRLGRTAPSRVDRG